MIDLVVFDMAGTTIDDHGLVYLALAEAVRHTGASIDEGDLQRWMGTDKLTAIAALMRLGGVVANETAVDDAFARFLNIVKNSYREHPPVALPGVEQALRTLRDRGVRTALSTGFSAEIATPLLESLGWTIGGEPEDLLDAVVTTTDVTAGRPAPYLIHRAMERTGAMDVRRVLAAGDTIVDLEAAINAGVVSVGVLTGALSRSQLESHPHDFILDSVVDVLGLELFEPEPAR